MFYLAKINYYTVIPSDDAENNQVIIPAQSQIQYFTINILISAISIYKAQKSLEENYGISLNQIIYIKPVNNKIININNINDIQQSIENQYTEEIGGNN